MSCGHHVMLGVVMFRAREYIALLLSPSICFAEARDSFDPK